jgi:plasmid stabilization system protein ParE
MPAANSRIIWAPAAKRDLREIWRYFAEVASLEVADRFSETSNRPANEPDDNYDVAST